MHANPKNSTNAYLFVTSISIHYDKWIITFRFNHHAMKIYKSYYIVRRKNTYKFVFYIIISFFSKKITIVLSEIPSISNKSFITNDTCIVIIIIYCFLFTIKIFLVFVAIKIFFCFSTIKKIYPSFCQSYSALMSTKEFARSDWSSFVLLAVVFVIYLLALLFPYKFALNVH